MRAGLIAIFAALHLGCASSFTPLPPSQAPPELVPGPAVISKSVWEPRTYRLASGRLVDVTRAVLYVQGDNRCFYITIYTPEPNLGSLTVAQDVSDIWANFKPRALRDGATEITIDVYGPPGSAPSGDPGWECSGDPFGIMPCERTDPSPQHTHRSFCGSPDSPEWRACDLTSHCS